MTKTTATLLLILFLVTCVGTALADEAEPVASVIVPVAAADDVLAQAGEEVLGWLRSAGDAVQVEAPILAEEVIRFGMVQHGYNVLMGLALFLSAVFVAVPFGNRAAAKAKVIMAERGARYSNDEEFPWIVGAVGSYVGALIGGIIGFFMALESVLGFAKVFVAPRLYLLEQIAGLVK
jgi:hypothetical protein